MTSDNEYQLVMPMVVVTSKGGPYDDESYCAGWEANAVAALVRDLDRAELPGCDVHLRMPVRVANLAQLDLIAMNAGWMVQTTMPVEPTDYWAYIMLSKSDGGPDPPQEA